jgi:hypothetical protein
MLAVALALASPVVGWPGAGAARVFHSQQEALALAFAEVDRIEARRFLLTDAQAQAIEAASRAPLATRIVTLHEGWLDGEVVGYALIDVHRVRSMSEALLVVVTPDARIAAVRVLAFHEPQDYLPKRKWFDQFLGRELAPELQLNHEIHGIAGATLTARAVTRSVRRALALHRVLVAGTKSQKSGD